MFKNGKIKAEKGKLLIFPSSWTYIHRGNIPISDDKYIITGWVHLWRTDEIEEEADNNNENVL